MKLKDYFIPDFYFTSVVRIKPEFFAENNIDCLICDIDNTLTTYDKAVPYDDIKEWLDKVEMSGVRLALISNNNEDRVYTFNTVLGYDYVSRAGKPFTHKLKYLMSRTGRKKENTALIGDQIFTDVLCARSAGIRSILVTSIDTRGRPFLQLKKHFEKYFIEEFFKKNGRFGQKYD